MIAPLFEARTVEYHKQDLLRQARIQQLAREAAADRATMQRRFRAMLADLLIASGERLKAGAELPTAPRERVKRRSDSFA
ncbi:MAG: hypothetical protein SNJ59_04590 [Aggregatilineales bacterium]